MRIHKLALSLIAMSAFHFAQADESKTPAAKKQESTPVAKEAKVEKKSEDLKKPAWLTTLSVAVKETYDSNIYATQAGVHSNRDSAITKINPTVEVNFAKMVTWDKDDEKLIDTLSLGYSPNIALFHGVAEESNTRHNISNKLKGKEGAFSFSAENTFSYVDGSRDGLIYSTVSAHSTGNPRERRNQIQDRMKVVLKYDINEDWFVRPTATLLYYDLLTKHENVASYQNWVDRYDVNGGMDLGYNINKDLAFIWGYRFGAQDHDHNPFTVVNQSSTYHRALIGLEGKIVKWLKIQTLVGPDFRDYTRTSNVGDSPRLYAEGSVTADITSDDALKFNVKAWQWVSSTGTSATFDNSYDLTYTRKWTKELTSDIGFKIYNIDYDNPPTLRNDTFYALPVKLNYKIDKNWSVGAEYEYSQGENDVDVTNVQGREFDRHIMSLGFKWDM